MKEGFPVRGALDMWVWMTFLSNESGEKERSDIGFYSSVKAVSVDASTSFSFVDMVLVMVSSEHTTVL